MEDFDIQNPGIYENLVNRILEDSNAVITEDEIQSLSEEQQIYIAEIINSGSQSGLYTNGKTENNSRLVGSFSRFDAVALSTAVGAGLLVPTLLSVPVWAGVGGGIVFFGLYKSILSCATKPNCSNDLKIATGMQYEFDAEFANALSQESNSNEDEEALKLSLEVQCAETDDFISKDAAIKVGENDWINIDTFTFYLLATLNRPGSPNKPINMYSNTILDEDTIDKICGYYQIEKDAFMRLFTKDFADVVFQEEINGRNASQNPADDPDQQIRIIGDAQNEKQQIVSQKRKEEFVALLTESSASREVKNSFFIRMNE